MFVRGRRDSRERKLKEQIAAARRAHSLVDRMCVVEEMMAHRKICVASRISHGVAHSDLRRAAMWLIWWSATRAVPWQGGMVSSARGLLTGVPVQKAVLHVAYRWHADHPGPLTLKDRSDRSRYAS